jgi:ABC-type uncharacterized transport system auxiliary subunit
MMKSPKQVAITLISATVCLTLTGCFYSSKETTHTAEPAVAVPAEPATSSTTTTTTDNGVVEKQRTTTYTYP